VDKTEFLSERLSSSEAENKETMLLILTILMLVNSANTQKRMAEKIIDTYFKPKKEK
jgi:hypothetical protein